MVKGVVHEKWAFCLWPSLHYKTFLICFTNDGHGCHLIFKRISCQSFEKVWILINLGSTSQSLKINITNTFFGIRLKAYENLKSLPLWVYNFCLYINKHMLAKCIFLPAINKLLTTFLCDPGVKSPGKLADRMLFTIYSKTCWFTFPGSDNYLASCTSPTDAEHV